MRQYLLSFAYTLCLLGSLGFNNQAVNSAAQPTDQKETSKKLDRIVAPDNSAKGSQDVDAAYPGTTPLRGTDASAGSVSSAPGADAMMTQDLLLVNPNKAGGAPKPLQSFVDNGLSLSVDSEEISFKGMRGLKVTVINETGRPILVDGDNAKALLASKSYKSVSVSILQKAVLPRKGVIPNTERMVVQVVPAAATVGATPTIEDYIKMKKPVRKRYGSDSQRRQAEASRFGKRILWPRQKTEGILYFLADANISSAQIEIPVHTLFDTADSAILSNSRH